MVGRISLAVLVLGVAVACYQDDSAGLDINGRPLARVFLTDAPFPYDSVESVNVHIVSLSASEAPDTSGTAPWTLIARPNKSFDLLTLRQGNTALLGEGVLSGRLYRAIRMVIDADRSSVRWTGGAEAEVRWPWPGTGLVTLHALVIEPFFQLVDESGIEIVIDWDVGRSFLYNYYGGRDFTVIPWLRAVHSAFTGAITGTVTTDYTGTPQPLHNAGITVYNGDPTQPPGTWSVAATGRTEMDGTYRIAFIGSATYIVRIEHATMPFLEPVVQSDVVVTDGGVVDVSASLPLAGAGAAYLRISGPTSVGVGGTITLHAAVGATDGAPLTQPTVDWWSSAPDVASVTTGHDTAGVTGHQTGWVTIHAASNGEEDSTQVQVVGSFEPVASVAVLLWNNTAIGTLAVNDSSGARAVLRDGAGVEISGRPISWFSTDTTVLKITGAFGEHVVFRARAPGTAQLRATSEGRVGEASVTVN